MPAAAQTEIGGNRAAITACAIVATLMQALDTTIANVSLPYMQGSLAASQDQIDWVLTSYIVAAAIMTPPTGFLAGRFGLKRLFLVAVGGFTIASMFCGMAQSVTQIVLFRVMQGGFGAALVPLSQTVLLSSYPRERQGFAMALFGLGAMVGPVLGPVLGTAVNRAFESPAIAHSWNPLTAAGRAALDAVITRQAQIIAFIDDYKLLLIATLAVIPLLMVFKKPAARGTVEPIAVVK
jgi:MFS family permease